MQYGWSKNDRKKPSSWQNLEFIDNTEEKASASLTINELDEVKYLWIKGGTELDNKRNKNSCFGKNNVQKRKIIVQKNAKKEKIILNFEKIFKKY